MNWYRTEPRTNNQLVVVPAPRLVPEPYQPGYQKTSCVHSLLRSRHAGAPQSGRGLPNSGSPCSRDIIKPCVQLDCTCVFEISWHVETPGLGICQELWGMAVNLTSRREPWGIPTTQHPGLADEFPQTQHPENSHMQLYAGLHHTTVSLPRQGSCQLSPVMQPASGYMAKILPYI